VGNFKNGGREWATQGHAVPVRVHDFVLPGLWPAVPYGVYDLGTNTGWISVGTDHDTAAFAVESIGWWWKWMGARVYPRAHRLLITADAGGSNGARVRLWNVELQKLADELRLPISVCHFPPGTSTWNKIEHPLVSFISQNWRGQPVISHEVIVKLIASTTTTRGLRVRSRLDTRSYPSGIKVQPGSHGFRRAAPGILSWRLELYDSSQWSEDQALVWSAYFVTSATWRRQS
jgi:hypothetical protein